MKTKILILILAIFFIAQGAFAASPFNAKAKTKRIPAGTKFDLQLQTPVTSYAGTNAEFSAILITDQTADSDVILPTGSLVRGNITKIIAAKRMSRGAVIYLDFDHIVTPNGRQLPLSLSVIGRADLTYDGGITGGRGYKEAVVENWHNTVDIVKGATNWGNETFEDVAGGYLRVVTVPVAAIGGGIGGAGYYVYEDIADLIRKGKQVNLKKGEVIHVILQQPIDVPVI